LTTLYAQWEKSLHGLNLYKEDMETSEPLEGAEFSLYKKENDMFLLVESFTTDVDEPVTYPGLETDTLYKLVEERPPNGYAVITKDIFFRLRVEGNSVSLVFCDAEGNPTSAPNGVFGSYNNGNHQLTMNVKNLRGYVLPSTGGMGTPIYILCGLILVLAPLVYGLSLRRKHERRLQE
jgi:LPXTG-motif cell wall-anchored protein